jgi:hypothetical protein
MVALIVLLSAGLTHAGEIGIFLSPGYALPLGGMETFDGEHFAAETYDNGDLTSVEDNYVSIGKGLKLEGGVQVAVDSHFAIRIGGGYSIFLPTLEIVEQGTDWKDVQELKASVINVHAMGIVRYRAGNVIPYGGMGPGLFLASATSEMTYTEDAAEEFASSDISFDPAIGFVGVLGVETEINDKLNFFAELNLQQAAFKASEWEVKEYTVDGVDELDEVDVDPDTDGNQTVYEYEKDSTTKDAPPVMQGSNFGVRVGLKLKVQ